LLNERGENRVIKEGAISRGSQKRLLSGTMCQTQGREGPRPAGCSSGKTVRERKDRDTGDLFKRPCTGIEKRGEGGRNRT